MAGTILACSRRLNPKVISCLPPPMIDERLFREKRNTMPPHLVKRRAGQHLEQGDNGRAFLDLAPGQPSALLPSLTTGGLAE